MKSKIVTQTSFHLISFIFYLLSFFLFLSSCSTQPYVVETTAQDSDSSLIAIFIVNHGWHTGIIVPADSVFQVIPDLQQRFRDAAYLEFGWGDKGFYQAAEITFGLTIQALFWPTESVVHVVPLPENIKSYFSDVQTLCISNDELSALNSFLLNSFSRDQQGSVIKGAKGIYVNGQFYMGTGSYHLFNTCNKWTAKGIESAGFNISPSLKLTAESIMKFVAIEQKDSGCHNGQ